MDIGEGKPDGHCYLFNSVRNNQRNFSILDQKRAEACRLLQEKCGFPSDTDFINAIENGKFRILILEGGMSRLLMKFMVTAQVLPWVK